MENPFDAHAVFAMGFVCDRCGKKHPGPDEPGLEKYTDEWYYWSARAAEKSGWFVPSQDDDGKMHVMFCLCEDCAQFKDEELRKTDWEKL